MADECCNCAISMCIPNATRQTSSLALVVGVIGRKCCGLGVHCQGGLDGCAHGGQARPHRSGEAARAGAFIAITSPATFEAVLVAATSSLLAGQEFVYPVQTLYLFHPNDTPPP